MTDAKDALAALKTKKAETPEAPDLSVGEVPEEVQTAPTPEPEPVVEPEPEVVEPVAPVLKDTSIKEYQSYTSARISTCLVTPGGIRINFTDYSLYTKNEDVIEYLNKTIKDGCKAIKIGERLSADEINPAAAFKRKVIEEFKASQEGRDFSGQGVMAAKAAAGQSGGAGTGMVTSDQVPSV